MTIPAFTPRPQNEPLLDEIKAALAAVVDSGQFIGGATVEAFESSFAGFVGAPHAIGVSSGTDALLVALMAAGVGAGDGVLTTPFTFFATAGVVHRLGAIPVFCDIEPRSFLMDPAQAEAAAARAPGPLRAVLPVHLFGRAAELGPWQDLARRHGAALIEDTAQALGARTGGQYAGTVGDAGCFSFYPTKNLGGLGDGGLVVCRDEAMAARLRSLRNHGMTEQYYHDHVGGNFRLDALQAAGLSVKLPHVPAWNAERLRLARLYEDTFVREELGEWVTPPEWGAPEAHVFHQYVVRVPRRDELRAALMEQGIGSSIFYPVPLHRQPCFAQLTTDRFPEAERAAEEVLALPMYPGLEDTQVEQIVEAIGRFFRD